MHALHACTTTICHSAQHAVDIALQTLNLIFLYLEHGLIKLVAVNIGDT